MNKSFWNGLTSHSVRRMDHKIAAGVCINEGVLLELRKRKTDPKHEEVRIAKFPPSARPERVGWNPVYWSEYPKEPMWTVPMPRMSATMSSGRLNDVSILPCHVPPTEYMTIASCPSWVPQIPHRIPAWNPYVSETNTCFSDLQGPLNR